MSMGSQIVEIRKQKGFTQEDFGKIFHVTRQTVSNWENDKSYPDLQTLVEMSEIFDLSLDQLLKEDKQMVKCMDEERLRGSALKKEFSRLGAIISAGTGWIIGTLLSPDSPQKNIYVLIGVAIIAVGIFLRSRCDKKILKYVAQQEQ